MPPDPPAAKEEPPPSGGGPAPADMGAWLTNVLSSAAIVMINKQLMGSKGAQYAFNFTTTLCAFHFILTAVSSRLLKAVQGRGQAQQAAQQGDDDGKDHRRGLPLADLVTFVIVANLSIVSLNMSLMLNNVSLYQIAKLGIPPFTAAVETTFFSKLYSRPQYFSMALTLAGVALVTVSEFSATGSTVGVCVAGLSVVSSGMQQILCGHYQRKNSMSSNDFLAAVSPWQGASMIILGPLFDRVFVNAWVWSYGWTGGSLLFLVLSCSCAVLVNASHFMCLGRFTAVSYQVMGHAKTVLVLGMGYLLFGGVVTQQQIAGIVLAIAGMTCYAYYTARTTPSKPPPSPAAKA
eukprot:TRINITY_DN55468_c0_g1_i1.p1 TRINITY_DN55468_c0_g1~~TRINITY_DN55468_c0_g1_i1.p1  ORF type:complete len:391 (+),score=145.24 TRINITY_DN55468_c0_g1_i1:131-1174(+)